MATQYIEKRREPISSALFLDSTSSNSEAAVAV
jgi:hypothetical protein